MNAIRLAIEYSYYRLRKGLARITNNAHLAAVALTVLMVFGVVFYPPFMYYRRCCWGQLEWLDKEPAKGVGGVVVLSVYVLFLFLLNSSTYSRMERYDMGLTARRRTLLGVVVFTVATLVFFAAPLFIIAMGGKFGRVGIGN